MELAYRTEPKFHPGEVRRQIGVMMFGDPAERKVVSAIVKMKILEYPLHDEKQPIPRPPPAVDQHPNMLGGHAVLDTGPEQATEGTWD